MHNWYQSEESQCFQGPRAAHAGHNASLCTRKPNVLGPFSPTKPLTLQRRRAAAALSALTQIPDRAWGFWNSAGWYLPNPDWGPMLGNKPFLTLLNRGGLGS